MVRKARRPHTPNTSTESIHYDFKEGLDKSKLQESFIWIITAHDEDVLYDSMTFWGVIIPDEIRRTINSDQELESWKFNAGSLEEVLNHFSFIRLGSFRHGFSLMGCGRCDTDRHSKPIFLCPGTCQPAHSIALQTMYGKLPDSDQERFFLVLGVAGGVFEAYTNPPLTGTLPVGILILQPQPFCL